MSDIHSLQVFTPEGRCGRLTHEKAFLFGYAQVGPASAVSLTMPVRSAQYAHPELHPIFQMNLPEGFMLEELKSRLAKIVSLEPMLLLSLSGGPAAIGRVRVESGMAATGLPAAADLPGERLHEILEWDGTQSLFEELVNKYIHRAGISGVQPKVLVPERMQPEPNASKATVVAGDLIVKSGRREYPGLAANEFLCMSIAKHAGIRVPEFYLSRNKELFVMKRFDRRADGSAIGFEDMAVLSGLSAAKKYASSYTRLAKIVQAFVSEAHVQTSLCALYDMVALSCIVGNGDAHLKNFGLLYSDPGTADCQLAPAFDIVNTTAYIPEDVMALELCGQKTFFAARQGLMDFAKVCGVSDPRDRMQRLILTTEFVLREEAEIADSVPHVVAAITRSAEMLAQVFMRY